MARRRRGREVDGVLLLDKPAGVSSNHILQRMKRLFGAAKAGHTGALDPLATGMLPICFGEATKFSQFLLDADKHYQTTAKLGIKTASGDAEGEVLQRRAVEGVDAARIRQLLEQHLSGQITQTPSMYSALKHQGQPLYKLARQGIEVPVKQRQVKIYRIELLDFRGDELDLDIHCSKGTYVRSIVEDLGELLGCGAHVSVLRRLDAGPYKAAMMHTPEQLQALADQARGDGDEHAQNQSVHQALDRVLLPPWTAVDHLPEVRINAEQSRLIRNGSTVVLNHAVIGSAANDTAVSEPPASPLEAPPAGGLVKIFTESREAFLGLGEISDEGALIPRRLIKTQ